MLTQFSNPQTQFGNLRIQFTNLSTQFIFFPPTMAIRLHIIVLCTESLSLCSDQDRRQEKHGLISGIVGNFDFLHSFLSLLSKHFDGKFRRLLRGKNISETDLKGKVL